MGRATRSTHKARGFDDPFIAGDSETARIRQVQRSDDTPDLRWHSAGGLGKGGEGG